MLARQWNPAVKWKSSFHVLLFTFFEVEGCFQRKVNGVSGNARLHHIRPKKIFLICCIVIDFHCTSSLGCCPTSHESFLVFILPISLVFFPSLPPTECFPKHYRDIDSFLYSWLSSQRATVASPNSLIQQQINAVIQDRLEKEKLNTWMQVAQRSWKQLHHIGKEEPSLENCIPSASAF